MVLHAAYQRGLDAGNMGPHQRLGLPWVVCEDGLVDPMMIVMPPPQVLVVEGDDVAA